MQKRSLRYSMVVVLVLVLALSMVVPASAKVGRYIDVQILSINDFHGALDQQTTTTVNGVEKTPVGRAQYLATHIKLARATNPNTVFVGGGDLIGASPLLSSLFHDEPTLLALGMMGMEFSAVGNHEFDEGVAELLRMQYGGCNPIDGCLMGDYPGAGFKYMAANVINDDTGKTLFPPYFVKNFGGARVGFIGVGYEQTPSIVTAEGTEGVTFKSELEAINKYAKQLKKMRINTIVVLLHNGFGSAAGCTTPTDPIYQMIEQVDSAVDVIIMGHSHQSYICSDIDGKLVTSAWYNGRMFSDIDLKIDKATGDVIAKSAVNVYNTQDVAPDQGILDLLAQYQAVANPIANAPVGTITASILRASNTAGESALGDVVADAQLAYTAPADMGGAQIAITNPGGVRTDLIYAQDAVVQEGDGVVTYGEAFAVQPFSNSLVTLDLTGQQLKDVLEQQVFVGTTQTPTIPTRILQVSSTFTYSWSESAPTGSKISAMKLNGVDMDMAATYRVTINNFLAGGGDGFTAFLAATNPLIGDFDIDAFVAYLQTQSPVAPGPQNRITRLP